MPKGMLSDIILYHVYDNVRILSPMQCFISTFSKEKALRKMAERKAWRPEMKVELREEHLSSLDEEDYAVLRDFLDKKGDFEE